jgi:hypothetical protein
MSSNNFKAPPWATKTSSVEESNNSSDSALSLSDATITAPPPPPPASSLSVAAPPPPPSSSIPFNIVNPLRFASAGAATASGTDAEKSPGELRAEKEAAQAKADALKAKEEAARVKEESRVAVDKALKEVKEARAEAASAKASAATAMALASSADSRVMAAQANAEAPPLYIPVPLHGVDQDGSIHVDEVSNKLIEYVVFIERVDLTKMPPIKPTTERTWGQCFCDMVCCKHCIEEKTQYTYNRLKHLRKNLFGKLDGPVSILEPSSFNPLTNEYTVLNYVDQEDTIRKKQATISGLVRKNVLYKLLPKENLFVPNADWVEQQERSEVMEVVHFLQLAGAVMIETEHRPVAAFMQPISMPDPVPKGEGTIDTCLKKSWWCCEQVCSVVGTAASAVATSSGPTDSDPLNGRIIFRNNAAPVKRGLEGLMELMGNDYFHVKRMPALMDRLRLRLDRGLLVADLFTLVHFNNSSTHLPGMRSLQENSMPDGVAFDRGDAIDCGWRSPFQRARYSTQFRILYPDVHEAKSGVLSGNSGGDIPLETVPTFDVPKNPMHPMSSLESWDNLKINGKTMSTSTGPSMASSFFAAKKKEDDVKGKPSEAEKKLKDQNKAERKAHIVELNAVKKQAAEMSVDLYLERSFREYIVTSKGIKEGKKPWGFSFPTFGFGRRSGGGATTGNGIAGFITKFLGKDEVSPSSDNSEDEEDLDEGNAIPEPISANRPIMTVPLPPAGTTTKVAVGTNKQ